MNKAYQSPAYFNTYKDFIPDYDLFLRAQSELPPVVIKRNSLKCSIREFESFIKRHLDDGAFTRCIPHEWVYDCYEVEAPKSIIGGLWEHHAGLFYMMGASSLLPVMALDPRPGESILDMCSAPGGKTFLISEKMNDQGVLIANEPSNTRRRVLKSNLDRMGILNAHITSYYGEKIPDIGLFDRILLDGPCSSEGSLRGAWSKNFDYSRNDEYRDSLQRSQKKLLDRAAELLKSKGRLVYSTCTYDPDENEKQVDEFLVRNPMMKLVDSNIKGPWVKGLARFQEENFINDLSYTNRVYPHLFNSWGFFFATFIKQ